LKKVNESLTYAVMFGSLVTGYVKFVIMLVELKKVLSQKPSVFVARLPQRYRNEPYQNLRM